MEAKLAAIRVLAIPMHSHSYLVIRRLRIRPHLTIERYLLFGPATKIKISKIILKTVKFILQKLNFNYKKQNKENSLFRNDKVPQK